MSFQPAFVRRFSLDNARVGELVQYAGSFVGIRRASSAGATLNVRFDEAMGDAIPLRLGEFFKGWPFERLVLSNEAQAGAWVELIVAGDAAAVSPRDFEFGSHSGDANVHIAGQDAPVEVAGPDAGRVPVELDESLISSNALKIWPAHPDGLMVLQGDSADPYRVRRQRWDVPTNWVDFDELQDVTGYTTFATAGASGLTIYEARVSHDAIDARGGIEVVDDGGSPVMQLRALGRDHRIVSRGLWGLHLPESYSIRVRKNGSSSGAVQAVVEGFVGTEPLGAIL